MAKRAREQVVARRDMRAITDDLERSYRAAVEQKRAGGTIPTAEPQAPPPTDDLMATLKKSLELRRPPAKAGAAPRSSPKAAPGRRRRAS